PIEKTKKSLEAASVFIDEVVATGRTNISGALARGLAGKRETKRPRIMIFLTDGSPTAGELVPEKIVENLSEMNESGTQIFVMGLGDDVNAHLLDGLSEGTNGSSEYVSPEEEIDVKVASLFNRLSNPVLTDIKISFGDLNTNSIYPQKLPALFKGSEIMVAGRYRDGGEHTVTISGTLGGKPVAHTLKAEFPAGVRGDEEFVATLWATRKIGYLLQEIRLHGENKELIDEVVHLSHKFGIVTEYTAFLATETRGFTQEEAAKEARKNISAANRQKAGKWAVSQACNDIDLQKRVRTGGQANSYIDRRGKVQTVQNIRQVGRRAFYLKEGQWEEADEQGDRKVRTVKLFSKEYFELLRNNPEFSKAQSIGWNLSVNVGNERIKVKK
ncbi:MAG: VWA domain-containing protein, partial [Planctomycetota bacterium]|nr:VWA domain-containing protein [Planctomycetota bacterium]